MQTRRRYSAPELYTCFSGTMLAIGIRYLADRDEAEDLLHDVFVNVLTNFHKFSYKVRVRCARG